ncbi:MAG: class I tRNA ligase family protein, partial [Pseudomonadota bacterium]
VAFHTVSFPCNLIGSEEPWKRVDTLKTLNWLTWYGGKFSTSEARGIFMDKALEVMPADPWRWYLMSNAPESDDTSFTLEAFAGSVNKDLADVLGNLVNRVTRFASSKFDAQVPDGGEVGAIEEALFVELDARIKAYTEYLEAIEFRKAFSELRAIWATGNEYLQEAAPWAAFKTDKLQAAMTVRTALNLIQLIAELSTPIIPFTSEKILAVFGRSDAVPAWPEGDAKTLLDRLPRGSDFTAPEVLFAKVEPEQIEAWGNAFGAPQEA